MSAADEGSAVTPDVSPAEDSFEPLPLDDAQRSSDYSGNQPAADDARPRDAQSDQAVPDEGVADEGGAAEAARDDEPPTVVYRRFDCTTDDAALLSTAADAAGEAVERGECIVLPTDTVYGIGADAFNPDAVQRLLNVKVRGRDMPPPVLIADASLIRVLALDVPQEAKDLVDRHWPGPLTVICQAQPSLRMDLGEAEGTIALRVPDHALAREVLRRTGPLAVSSANISGSPAAVTCDEAVSQLGDGVAVYLDGGRSGSADSLPSTIVDFSQGIQGQVLRHGALSVDLLRETCPDLEDLVEPAPQDPPAAVPEPAPAAEPTPEPEPTATPTPADGAPAEDEPGAEPEETRPGPSGA